MIAIVSYISIGSYDANTVNEDEILSSILSELEFDHEIVPWSDPTINWGKYSTLLIKSTWDYFDYYPEFLKWIEKIKNLNIKVLNGVETLLWNSSKNYLSEIKEKGYPVISGQQLNKGTEVEFELIKEAVKSDTWVLKPLVSGGAKNTLKIESAKWSEFSQKVQDLVNQEDFLLQPFIQEVQEIGEYSLIFFNAEFSHAVLKTPAKGDFRVQHYFGGEIKVIEPSTKMINAAKSIIEDFAPNSLYTRVDGVEIEGEFHLMELELIEPYLFLSSHQDAISNYKNALKKRLN
ncbi:glutathione synthetase [Algoriphagus sp.]|uniref:ATP-grasp domain-containing protein n=1 Tax=Algoriphagus sp. TaxID=1872435 RepID=UPI0025CEAE38|nr:glutathione synthetase [Algoriphagus sp.]